MKRFEFPLERIRQYRKLQMETEQARLEECRARLLAVEELFRELARQREQSAADIRVQEAAGNELEVSSPAQAAQFRGYLGRVETMLEARRRTAEDALEAQRKVVIAARQKFEVLDRYRGTSLKTWQSDFNREQEALASELFLAKWRPSRSGVEGEPAA